MARGKRETLDTDVVPVPDWDSPAELLGYYCGFPVSGFGLEEGGMQRHAARGEDAAELLCVRELAALLGMGESTARACDRKGLLPAPVRIGGALRWSRQEIHAWIGAGSPARAKWVARRGRC